MNTIYVIWLTISAIALIIGIICIVDNDEHNIGLAFGWMIIIPDVVINIIVWVVMHVRFYLV